MYCSSGSGSLVYDLVAKSTQIVYLLIFSQKVANPKYHVLAVELLHGRAMNQL
jgi:hypothetical protein